MTNTKHFLRFFMCLLIMIFSYQGICCAQEEEEILAIKSIQLGDVLTYARQRNKAISTNDIEAAVKASRTIAQIYTNRENYIQAQNYLHEAVDLIQKTDRSKSQLQFIDLSFAIIYEKVKDHKQSLNYAEKCIAESNHQRTTIEAKILKALNLYYLKRFNDFEKVYTALQVDKTAKKYLKGRVAVMHYIRGRNFRSAHSTCNAILDEGIKTEMLMLTCQAEGRYEEAMKFLNKLEDYNNRHMQEIRARDFEESNAALGVEKRESKIEQMKLEQKKLDIDNQNMLREKGAAEEEAAKLKTHNNNLHLEKMKLKREETAKKMEMQKVFMAEREKKEEHLRWMRTNGIIALLLIISLMIIFLIHRYFASKHLKKHNLQLEIARKLVEESDKTKTVFLQNVSHEIRTPLNAILGFSQILTCKDFPLEEEEKKEYARLVRENSEQLTTLITDIFLLSDLDSGKVTITNGVFKCNQLCREAIEEVKGKVEEGVNIIFNTDLDEDFPIKTDGAHFKLILTNLLTNSEKYTNAGEIRLIATKAGKDDVAFAVEDTGSGIPKDKSEQVFERFEKLGSFIPGNGLGLPISRAIGKLMNLELKMDTSYDGGSRFTLKRMTAILLMFLSCTLGFSQTEHEKVYINEHEAIFWLLRQNDSTAIGEAIERAQAMRAKAAKENFPFGTLSAFRTLSCIYLERLNYYEAIKVLDEAETYLNRAKCPSEFYSIIYYEKARNYDYLNDAQACHDFALKAMANPFSVKTSVLARNLYVRSLYKQKRYDEFLEEYEKMKLDPNFEKYLLPGRADIYYCILKKDYEKAHEISNSKESELSRLETEIEIFKAEKKPKEALEASQRAYELKNYQSHYVNHQNLVQFYANFKDEFLRSDSLSASNLASALVLEQAKIARAKQQAETDKENAKYANSNLLMEKMNLESHQQQLEREALEEQEKALEEEAAMKKKTQYMLIITLVLIIAGISFIMQHVIKVRRQLGIQEKELQAALEKAEESDRLKTAFMDNLNVNLSDQLNEVNTASSELFSVPEPPEEKRFSLANEVFNAASDMMKVVNDVLTYSQKAAMQEFATAETAPKPQR